MTTQSASTTLFSELKTKIEARQARVAVIGLGYVGLPLALLYTEQIEAGVVKVNQISTGLALQAPFGGVKKSSTDSFKEQGAGAIEFYTKLKTVYLDYSV